MHTGKKNVRICFQSFRLFRCDLQIQTKECLTRLIPVAFHIETSHFVCTTNQITGFYITSNTSLKWLKIALFSVLNCIATYSLFCISTFLNIAISKIFFLKLAPIYFNCNSVPILIFVLCPVSFITTFVNLLTWLIIEGRTFLQK